MLNWKKSMSVWLTANSLAYQELKEACTLHFQSSVSSRKTAQGKWSDSSLFCIRDFLCFQWSTGRQLCSIVSNASMLTEELLGFIKAASKLVSLKWFLFSKMQQEISYKLHYRNHFPINSNLATTDIRTSHTVVLPTLSNHKSTNTWDSSQTQRRFQFASPPASFSIIETLLRPWTPN